MTKTNTNTATNKKQEVREFLYQISPYDLEGKFEHAIKTLQEQHDYAKSYYEKKQYHRFELDCGQEYDTIVFYVYGYRTKTDKELLREQQEREEQEGKRYKQYLALKKEFEGK